MPTYEPRTEQRRTGKQLFEARVPMKNFVRDFLRALQRLRVLTVDSGGMPAHWPHTFPQGLYEDMERTATRRFGGYHPLQTYELTGEDPRPWRSGRRARSDRRQTDRMTPLDVITRYYDGCSTGDVELMRSTLHPDVVHWFLAPNPGSAPVSGDEHLARYWRKVQGRIDARWVVDHALCSDAEAVIEWSMWWRPGGTGERIATRGAEWFTFSEGLIREIRSYYQQREETTELDAFDYAGRGYSVPGAEASGIHLRAE